MGKIKEYIQKVVSEIKQEIWGVRYDISGMKTYSLVSTQGKQLFPGDCHDEPGVTDLYNFECPNEIMVGDCIRVTDNTYHKGMVKVVERVYNRSDNAMYLVCVMVDETNDYIYKKAYETFCKNYVRDNRNGIDATIAQNEDGLSRVIERIMYDAQVDKMSTVDWWNKDSRTREIVYPLLGLEYKRPSRWDFDDE